MAWIERRAMPSASTGPYRQDLEDIDMKILGSALIAVVCFTAGPVLAGKKKKEEAAEPAPAAAPAAGGTADCVTNYKQEGNYIAGRRFSTSGFVPNVTTSVAYKRIYQEGVKSGLKLVSGDEKMGAIQFDQPNAGSSWGSTDQVSITWSVFLEAEGKGVRVSISKITPPAYATGKDFQIKSMCAVVDAAAGKPPGKL
jgi:hypothetical protein